MNRSKLAVTAAFFGGLGLFDAVVGPLLARIELIAPMAAFYFWILGSLAGIIGLVIGLLALRPTGAGGKTGRGLALVGIVSGAVLLGVFLLNAGQGGDYPPINDITTDLADPPQFKSDPADRGRDMAYPADFVPTVKAAYGDLASIVSRNDPAKALDLAVSTAERLGWEVVETDPAAGTLRATHTTEVFRFVDDIVVRVRPGPQGSLIDVRSKSRDGQGDIGANAIRIRAFAEAFPN